MAVVVGEGVVALVSAFEARDGDERDAEVVGDGGEGEVFGLSGGPQVTVVVDGSGPGEQSEHFADDRAFEQPQNLFFWCGLWHLDAGRSREFAGGLDMRTTGMR